MVVYYYYSSLVLLWSTVTITTLLLVEASETTVQQQQQFIVKEKDNHDVMNDTTNTQSSSSATNLLFPMVGVGVGNLRRHLVDGIVTSSLDMGFQLVDTARASQMNIVIAKVYTITMTATVMCHCKMTVTKMFTSLQKFGIHILATTGPNCPFKNPYKK
jgi:hypothetical protein